MNYTFPNIIEAVTNVINSEQKLNQSLECQVVLRCGKKHIKNRKKFIGMKYKFLHPVFLGEKQKVVKVLSNDVLLAQEIGPDAEKHAIVSLIKSKKITFDFLLADVLCLPLITPYAKKLSTQGVMPKEEFGMLHRNSSTKDLLNSYQQLTSGKQQILKLVPNNVNSVMYFCFGNTTNLNHASENLTEFLNNVTTLLSENENVLQEMTKISKVVIKTQQGKVQDIIVSDNRIKKKKQAK